MPFLVLVVSTMIGNLVGKLAGVLVGGGALHDILAEGFRVGTKLAPWHIDLWIADFTVGFNFDVNLFGLMFALLAMLVLARS